MTLSLQENVDFSPAVFGQLDDPIRIAVTRVQHPADWRHVLEDLRYEVDLPASPRAQASVAALLLVRPALPALPDLPSLISRLRQAGLWTWTLTADALPAPADHDPQHWVEALFPAAQALVLGLRPGEELRIVWPSSLPLQPLEWAVRRALRWRSSWTAMEDGDAVTGPQLFM